MIYYNMLEARWDKTHLYIFCRLGTYDVVGYGEATDLFKLLWEARNISRAGLFSGIVQWDV